MPMPPVLFPPTAVTPPRGEGYSQQKCSVTNRGIRNHQASGAAARCACGSLASSFSPLPNVCEPVPNPCGLQDLPIQVLQTLDGISRGSPRSVVVDCFAYSSPQHQRVERFGAAS